MKKVGMLDLSEQYMSLKNEIIEELNKVMESSQFILGDNVRKLESILSKYSNTKHGIGVGNGSDAIHIALQAAGVEEGDEVITTPFTFFATGGAIARAHAKPVFVDINSETFNIDVDKIEEAITERTKAIIPVHLYGQMADMEKIQEIATKHKLYVIEDAAQAIGANIRGKKVGELGSAATYSFFPTKNLGGYGDGGMIVTNDDEIANLSKIIRVHGSKPKYHHHILGYNSRLDELQAAILNVKFAHLEEYTKSRRTIAHYYTRKLKENISETIIKTPYEVEGYHHVYHQYTLRVENRDALQEYLKENGVSSMIYYPVPLHLQPVFSELGYKEGDFPETEKAAKEAISLPIWPEMKKEQQNYVIEKVIEFYNK